MSRSLSREALTVLLCGLAIGMLCWGDYPARAESPTTAVQPEATLVPGSALIAVDSNVTPSADAPPAVGSPNVVAPPSALVPPPAQQRSVSGSVPVSASGAKRSWGPEQVIGEPDTPEAGDQVTAWASRDPDANDEWLECAFAQAVNITLISVHETYNPGALIKVTAFRADGTEELAWEGEDPTPRDQPKGISVIPVEVGFPCQKIKLYLDSQAVPGWNEIDAVGIEDEQGQKLWSVAVEASSTYAQPEELPVIVDGTQKLSWGPEQVTGEPDVTEPGDNTLAWASLGQDDREEWLLCRYGEPVIPTEVVVHETYNPGAVSKVLAYRADGSEELVWEGDDPTPRDLPQGVSIFPISIDYPIQSIKVVIDSVAVPGWNEIDAVGLRTKEGMTYWATEAESSTTYADMVASATVEPYVYVSAEQLMQLQSEIEQMRAELEELKQMRLELQEIKKLLQSQQPGAPGSRSNDLDDRQGNEGVELNPGGATPAPASN